MNWSDISFRPSSRMLRQFAGLWLGFFLILALWQGGMKDRRLLAWTFTALAVTVGPAGLIWPPLVRPIFVAWMVLAFPIGWTVSRVLLAILFYGLFTPIGLFFRLTRRDALARCPVPEQPTYWTPKPSAAGARSYFEQF